MDKKLVAVGGVGILLCIAVVALVLSPNEPAVSGESTAGVQTITASPATVDFAPGTTGTGVVAGGVLSYSLGANASIGIVNASLTIQNSTTILYNVNLTSGQFGQIYQVTAPQTWGTLYMNFTAQNNSATFSSSTNTFTMNPAFGTASKVDYGSYVTVSGGLLNDTMATIQLYYPSLYIKGFEYIDSQNVSIVLSKRA